MDLHPLLAWLDEVALAWPTLWQGWQIQPVSGGMNNQLFRTRGWGDLAVKFTLRDARDRAGREFGALRALRATGMQVAPAPLLLERDCYCQPVVVQQWVEGVVKPEPPESDDEWHALLGHLAAIHCLTPERIQEPLPRVVLTAFTPDEALTLVRQQVARLPPEALPPALPPLLSRLEASRPTEWPAVQPVLCRGDNNPRNFLRRGDVWNYVDWEYSGWGDPAFELAELLAQPNYRSVTPARREWVLQESLLLEGTSNIETRTRFYGRALLVWWVARLARLLHEVPRGGDPRLTPRASGWEAEARANLAWYLARAEVEV